MLASRVFSSSSRSVIFHCPCSSLLSPSHNQQFQILSKHFHYLWESPNKLAICKASLLHHAALSSSASRLTKEEATDIDGKLAKLIKDNSSFSISLSKHTQQEAIEFEEKVRKFIGEANSFILAKREQKSNIQAEEPLCNAKPQPTKSQSIKTRFTNATSAKTSCGDAKDSKQNKNLDNSNSKSTKSELELLVDDLVQRVATINSMLEWKSKKIMKIMQAEDDICRKQSKLEQDMRQCNAKLDAKLEKNMKELTMVAKQARGLAKFAIGCQIFVIVCNLWFSLDVV